MSNPVLKSRQKSQATGDAPLRAELFSQEQLATHARLLAAGHHRGRRRGANELLKRLDANEQVLRTFNRATSHVDSNRRITPAAEWLFDNFFLIEEQIQMARRHFPPGYSRELPRLLSGQALGFPRVYDVVLEMIIHVDAQIEAAPLASFVSAYESVAALSMGELWAIPIMLRLGLIENLQRITSRLMFARAERDLADVWVNRLQDMAGTNPSHLVVVVADMAKSELPVTSSFVAEFCQRLSGQTPVLDLARGWLEQHLGGHGLSIEQLIHQESQNQAADQVSVSHSISSLRLLSSIDWPEFVEGLSEVEAALRSDPAEVYGRMDFATRDEYRHSVEFLARHSRQSEQAVAGMAIRLAKEAAMLKGANDRCSHVGYYLVDQGREELARACGVRWPWRSLVERGVRRFPLTFYVGGISVLTLVTSLCFVREALGQGMPVWKLGLLGPGVLLCASQLAVALMNWVSMQLVSPKRLPRLDYAKGIDPVSRTMVVVPTLLSSPDGVDRLLEILQIHYLANRDECLHFALLTDFADAGAETLPGDAVLLQRVGDGIRLLNEKYCPGFQRLFFLLHRPRRWNEGEGLWMGYERKRGKLMEFNALLRGGAQDCFSEIVGERSLLLRIKYVITLDTDTQLPRDAARQLVGAMAHRLNWPEFDPGKGVVREGYGILQPRVGVSLPSARRSWFVRLFAGDSGIDPYTREVSDVYQDVFQEGSFVGKGIYDVDAFLQAMKGRFPENRILSHDLLEACHARSALVSDVELYEEYPSRYNVDINRRHRWIRGDWQITQWLLPRVPGPDVRRIANPLSVLSRCKIFDNLRRSLVPAGLLLVLFGAGAFFPDQWLLGLTFVLCVMAFPPLLGCFVDGLRKAEDQAWPMHVKCTCESCGRQLAQICLALAFLPYDAFISLDAILRTLVRLVVTRKGLLEWQSSGDTERTACSGLAGFYASMWIAPVLAAMGALWSYWFMPSGLPVVLSLAGLWLAAPCIAWWLSCPIEETKPALSGAQVEFLGKTARRTWLFFETFVTAEEHWLPPDNFQEIPQPTIASRTSPTNMGLALLANLAARDFGYVTLGGFISRTQETMATMQGLERYRGHFYNWYETRTLKPCLPLYVSSVDSGNLAGHLMTLAAGLREQADETLFGETVFGGLRDTLHVLGELDARNEVWAKLDQELADAPGDLSGAYLLLEAVSKRLARVEGEHVDRDNKAGLWIGRLRHETEAQRDEIRDLVPWLSMGLQRVPGVMTSLPMVELLRQLFQPMTLRDLAGFDLLMCPLIASFGGEKTIPFDPLQRSVGPQLEALTMHLQHAGAKARGLLVALETLARQCDELAHMDFSLLYDKRKDLFCVGFQVLEQRCDSSFYDLLASEARLCSYVAVAQGQVPQKHWFSLGRLLIASRGEPILGSWSGSMFEYLMPLLVMPSYANTLLDSSCRAAVRQQIEYGRLRGVPWGISESAYNRTDVSLNYQYRAFGVPGLGLKRGLADDLVIAPYASALALLLAPEQACENLQLLAAEGRTGLYGYYEAVDYTPARLPPGEESVTIRSFMAHHQGMSLLALLSLLKKAPMQRRFMACPMLKAADLLLQERVPSSVAKVLIEEPLIENARRDFGEGERVMRVLTEPNAQTPDVHLLSNGRYHVVISSAGGGYSRWGDQSVTRWREDSTRDCWGTFIYVRDQGRTETWSAAYQPTLHASKGYEAIFTQARAEFRQSVAGLEMHTEICVSPEDDVELRRLTLTNRGAETRTLEVTSYAELVLAPQGADLAHPAFSNLFVETEFLPEQSALLCSRRHSGAEGKSPWFLHLLSGAPDKAGPISCETDRSRFLGRGRGPGNAAAMQKRTALSNTVGPVLDPIASLRRTFVLVPQESVLVDLVFGVTESREKALGYVGKYQNPRMVDRAFDLAWTHGQVALRHLNATEIEAQRYERMVSALVYADVNRRAGEAVLKSNQRGQNGLWSQGVSGTVPIVLLRIGNVANSDLVRDLVQAHSYWRLKGLAVELVILNDDDSVYRQSLHDQITRFIASGTAAQMLDKPGGIFVRRREQVPEEDRILLQAAARIVLDDLSGSLAEQLERRIVHEPPVSALIPSRSPWTGAVVEPGKRDLIFDNGTGGFTRDGREYVITLRPGETTPAPWVNVIANPFFGTLVSENGSAYTWLENAHEYRLTPWKNDPVQDTAGEALYLRDEQTGEYWSPTPAPVRGAGTYVIRHGFGYTVYEFEGYGLHSELWVYVAMDAPLKFAVLKVSNRSGRTRTLSVTGYWEWVLGELRENNLLHVQTEVDLPTGALLARNRFGQTFPERIVFVDANDEGRTVCGDRLEFLGRNRGPSEPAALKRKRLSGKVGAGLDPCGAVQIQFELPEGHSHEVSFHLGVGRNIEDVRALIQRFRPVDANRVALEQVWAHWNRALGAVTVETPDQAVNVMANGWLLYQTLSCRLWGRSGFYQSGGAFGFRDQLQDVLALVYAAPGLVREHLLRAAAQQFNEGDVQHWWHPPSGRGVRTHSSDDFLWLPFATCRYVTCSGDTGVLNELVPFLEGRALRPDEESLYDFPRSCGEAGVLYEHCVRAIEHGLRFGAHGLPLIGGGDWNDGMNRAGRQGRGESVWLAFFLCDVLRQFEPIARARQDAGFAARCREQAGLLAANIERHAWDGDWYLRAFFDDGEAMGSKDNLECRIDSLPQSWSVISRVGSPLRARLSMDAVSAHLIRRKDGVVQLFDPPFDKTSQDPGYIKGYLPGVRENGGQYTHAAIWAGIAFSLLGEGERAWEVFNLLNPIHHASTPAQVALYKVEPFVVAADVYAFPPHIGRGGWTWYTGSAAWMYRFLMENLLGLQVEGETLSLTPCMPDAWESFLVHYCHRRSVYHIRVQWLAPDSAGSPQLSLDGAELVSTSIPLVDDGMEHTVELSLSRGRADGVPSALDKPPEHGCSEPRLGLAGYGAREREGIHEKATTGKA